MILLDATCRLFGFWPFARFFVNPAWVLMVF
jgi:hypothetical protein